MLKIKIKGKEFIKLAKSINAMNIILNDLEDKIYTLRYYDLEHQLIPLIYAARVEIWDRIEKNLWSSQDTIIVPSISRKKIFLFFALQNTVDRLMKISEEYGFKNIYAEFMVKGKAFHEFENSMPQDIRNGFYK